jgi:hypothetical protein
MMSSKEAANFEQLRKSFENREAIYIEKGALRVRVSNIQADTHKRWVKAEVEEIFTPGLGAGLFYKGTWNEGSPRRWEIGAGDLTTYSDYTWAMGYGGWYLFFATRVLEGVVDLAAQWANDLDAIARSSQVAHWLVDHDAYEQSRRLFPD